MRTWGTVTESELARPVIISPHLDDAVLSCGEFMSTYPGCTVMTVFAGAPERYPVPQREWDRQSGFHDGDDVMQRRREEDRAALRSLDASPIHLDFIEHTYNVGDRPVSPEVLAPEIESALREIDPTLILFPFGLANPDHDVTHQAMMQVRDAYRCGDGEPAWMVYEDCGYKHIPGMLAWRVSQLFRAKHWPTPVCPRIDRAKSRKADAIQCYPTQLRALNEDWDIAIKLAAPAPEQFWRLETPPSGWERLAES